MVMRHDNKDMMEIDEIKKYANVSIENHVSTKENVTFKLPSILD